MTENVTEMTKKDVIEAINENPVFYLATVEGEQPRVRGMLMYHADEQQILFHTAITKDLYPQLIKQPQTELCFNANGVQIRISGKVEAVDDNALKDQIANDPTRAFLNPWRKSISVEEFHRNFAVFRLTKGHITLWTMDRNLLPKVEFEF